MTTNEILIELLSTSLSKYGSYLGMKKVVSKLPTVAYYYDAQGVTLEEMERKINAVGEILGRDEEAGTIIAVVKAGAANMNPALVGVMSEGETIHLVAYAKEGLIKQHTSEKAIARIMEA